MVVSCTNINKGNDTIVSTVIEFKPDGIEQSLAECVDSVSFLVLKENEDNAFGNVDKVVVENDMLYVGDFRNKKIVSFYMNGDPGFVSCLYFRQFSAENPSVQFFRRTI